MKQMTFRCTLAVLLALAVFPSLVLADFYVIPVVQKMKNVVTVAKSGGKFTDVNAAMDSITDASENNPYLVLIGPGVYTMTTPLQLKAYVTVMGSGEQATLLKGAISTGDAGSSAIILGTDNATLTQLSVENTGGGSWCVGIYNESASPTMTNVTATASGGNAIIGVYNNSFSSPTMTNVTASASGGDYSIGVRNTSHCAPTMTNVTATASGGTSSNYGVENGLSSPKIRNCTLKGTTYGAVGAKVVLSTVSGGGLSAVCNSCFDENGTALGTDCNP